MAANSIKLTQVPYKIKSIPSETGTGAAAQVGEFSTASATGVHKRGEPAFVLKILSLKDARIVCCVPEFSGKARRPERGKAQEAKRPSQFPVKQLDRQLILPCILMMQGPSSTPYLLGGIR